MRRVLVVAGQLRFRSRLVDKKKLGNGDMAGPSHKLWRLWVQRRSQGPPDGGSNDFGFASLGADTYVSMTSI